MKRLKTILIVTVLGIAAYWVLTRMDVIPSVGDLFKSQPVIIDKTPILVKEIKSIGQLITYSWYDEVVVDSAVSTRGSRMVDAFNLLAPIPLLPSASKKLVLIGRGRVLAGTDLTQVSGNNISLKNDTLELRLPPARILDAILNPSDFETFLEKGEWHSNEVTLIKIKARNKMIQRALKNGILQKAGERSKLIMTDFLSKMGYKQVIIY